MLKKRDMIVAALAVSATLAGTVLAHAAGVLAAPVLDSSAYDWKAVTIRQVKPGVGSYHFMRAPTRTLDELNCKITTLDAGVQPHPPHKHPEEELIIVKEGTVEATLEGETRRVGPGSMIFQASNQMHAIRNVGRTRADLYVIKWNSPGTIAPTLAPTPAMTTPKTSDERR